MRCRLAKNKSDYEYLASLYCPQNTKYLLFKKMTAREVEEKAKADFRFMYVVEENSKRIGSFSLRDLKFLLLFTQKARGRVAHAPIGASS